MANIFGQLGLSDTDRVFNGTIGQEVLYDVAAAFVASRNDELNRQIAVWVAGTTANHTERYRLPGGGYLEERGNQGKGTFAPARATGYWDVAYPLNDYGGAVEWDDVTMAYMTANELSLNIQNVVIKNQNTTRFQLLKSLFNNVAGTHIDPLWGSLTVQRLANGDATLYPPVLGSSTEATDNHYLESGYAAADISDTNNPFVTIRDELEEHFGAMTGGENIVVFVNPAQRAKIEALSDFVEVPDQYIRVGQDTAVPSGLPNVPGRIYGRVNGCWVVEWRWVPANYMMANHLEVDQPLKMRIDPADTGLGMGLQLVATDERFPLTKSVWRNRFGFGASNRLNGVIMELGTGGSYTIPTAYA
ncbi:MAG: hypothetical protein IPL28_26375 [Chloroflexi bacterium]|nr:hypothetical protein [Chloroflexota bacterium]